MVEFGAKLSLKDNMYVALQKNLKMQRQFSEQVKKTSDNVKELAKSKVAPVIQAKDKATSTINKVKDNVKTVGKMVAKPFVTVKDGATKVINKITSPIKKLGKTVAKPFVALKDRASPVLSKIKGTLKSVGSAVAKPLVAIKDGATAGLSKIKDILGTLAKGATIAVSVAGAGLTALTAGSIKEGASMEQSIGGVETLYKGDAGIVTANADKAFKTAGLSANQYMETVTSFSASLLQSVAGDTTKSAQIADMAIIDMADNANKMGTSMDMIQNAYQGFAKQNYTMLDNLKLGYGGTQEEMQRLLSDASKLSGVEYDMSNLSDVYNAIHVIQEDLGITGTTAKEASETFSGSFASMKASAKNLLGNLALGGDITGSMEQLVDTATTFLFNNAIPMIGRIFEGLPDAIGTAVEKGAPKLMQLGGTIVTAIKNGLKTALPSGMGSMIEPMFEGVGTIFNSLKGMFSRVAPIVTDALGSAFADGGSFIEGFVNIVTGAIPVVEQIIKSLAQVFKAVVPAIKPILKTLGKMIETLFPVIQDIIASFGNIVSDVFPIIASVIGTALNACMPVIRALVGVIQTMLPIVQTIISSVAGTIQSVMPTISRIFTEVGSKIAEIITTVVVPVMNVLQGIFETVSPIIQSAIEIVTDILSASWDIISPIIDFAMGIFEALWGVVEAVFPAIQATVETVWNILEPVFEAIADGLSLVGDAVDAVGGALDTLGGWIGDGVSAVGDFFGFAYGKDRVPYDNYPAILHQGEKVLTRNQADQYDRHMSTRGVQLAQSVQEVPRADDGGTSTDSGIPTPAKPTNGGGTNISIEKLADTVVIEKEADVDKVVEDMVKKFRKLVPNMA